MDRRLIRAGRALLGWSQQELADRAGVQRLVVVRYENGTQIPHPRNMDCLIAAFDQAGVEQFVREDGAIGLVMRASNFAATEDKSDPERP